MRLRNKSKNRVFGGQGVTLFINNAIPKTLPCTNRLLYIKATAFYTYILIYHIPTLDFEVL